VDPEFARIQLGIISLQPGRSGQLRFLGFCRFEQHEAEQDQLEQIYVSTAARPIFKAADENSRIEVKNTTCYMCACRCCIRVTLRDGEVRYIEGNPDHPLNKGVICAKGASGIMKQYLPARLTKPLLRKPGSRRGDN
jgi:predicted molibdopterin-dependent oxidoreductase YjgC